MRVTNFGKLSVDGTKVGANASKRKAMSRGRMLAEERRLEREIEALVTRARETEEGGGRARAQARRRETRRAGDRTAVGGGGGDQLIVAAEVTSNASNQGHLVGLLDEVEAASVCAAWTRCGARGTWSAGVEHQAAAGT